VKFSDNGYYLEEYTKCDNCGVLLYRSPIRMTVDGVNKRYCSDWCVDWDMKRESELANRKHETEADEQQRQRLVMDK
jgi:hypothetical protein